MRLKHSFKTSPESTQTTHLKPNRERFSEAVRHTRPCVPPFAHGRAHPPILLSTATYAPTIHQSATRGSSVTTAPRSSTSRASAKRTWRRPTLNALPLTSASRSFTGYSHRASGFTTGNCLIILDSGAAVDVCCDRTYLIPGTERPCKRQILETLDSRRRASRAADWMDGLWILDGALTRSHAQARRSLYLAPI
eukprot:scaffold15303_cov122-Isochrysis_galbana.AAC.1